MIKLSPAIVYTGLICFLVGLIFGSVLTGWPAYGLGVVIGLVVVIGIGYSIYLSDPSSKGKS